MTTILRALRRILLLLAFAALPAAGGAGGLALAPLVGAAGAAAIRPSLAARPWARPALLLAFGFVAWACLASLWSPYPDHSQALRLAATALTGLAFAASAGGDVSTQRLVRAAGLAAILVLSAQLAVEALTDMAPSRAALPGVPDWQIARNPGRAVSLLVVIVWAGLAALLARRGVLSGICALILLAAVLALSTQFSQAANMVAAGLGLVAFAAGWLMRALALRLIPAAFAIWLLAAPFLSANPSWAENAPFPIAVRAKIWAHASGLIFERPIFGHGLDAARVHDATILFRGESVDLMPLHPHSASLHIWLETGAVGAILAAAALILAGTGAARAHAANRPAAAAICAALTSFAVLANSTYGAWQEWWIAVACIAGAMINALPRANT